MFSAGLLYLQVLGKMPRKTFRFERRREKLMPLALPGGLTPQDALDRVLRLPAVASKRFLTTKVDRCVTGRHFPLASLWLMCLLLSFTV